MVNFLNIEKKKERQKRIIQIFLIFLSFMLFVGIIAGLIYGAILDAEHFKREEIHKDINKTKSNIKYDFLWAEWEGL